MLSRGEPSAKSGALSEEKVAAKEAVLERQISEQTWLLTHLKFKRSLWSSEPEGEEALSSGAGSTEEGEEKKWPPKGRTKPIYHLESAT